MPLPPITNSQKQAVELSPFKKVMNSLTERYVDDPIALTQLTDDLTAKIIKNSINYIQSDQQTSWRAYLEKHLKLTGNIQQDIKNVFHDFNIALKNSDLSRRTNSPGQKNN